MTGNEHKRNSSKKRTRVWTKETRTQSDDTEWIDESIWRWPWKARERSPKLINQTFTYTYWHQRTKAADPEGKKKVTHTQSTPVERNERKHTAAGKRKPHVSSSRCEGPFADHKRTTGRAKNGAKIWNSRRIRFGKEKCRNDSNLSNWLIDWEHSKQQMFHTHWCVRTNSRCPPSRAGERVELKSVVQTQEQKKETSLSGKVSHSAVIFWAKIFDRERWISPSKNQSIAVSDAKPCRPFRLIAVNRFDRMSKVGPVWWNVILNSDASCQWWPPEPLNFGMCPIWRPSQYCHTLKCLQVCTVHRQVDGGAYVVVQMTNWARKFVRFVFFVHSPASIIRCSPLCPSSVFPTHRPFAVRSSVRPSDWLIDCLPYWPPGSATHTHTHFCWSVSPCVFRFVRFCLGKKNVFKSAVLHQLILTRFRMIIWFPIDFVRANQLKTNSISWMLMHTHAHLEDTFLESYFNRSVRFAWLISFSSRFLFIVLFQILYLAFSLRLLLLCTLVQPWPASNTGRDGRGKQKVLLQRKVLWWQIRVQVSKTDTVQRISPFPFTHPFHHPPPHADMSSSPKTRLNWCPKITSCRRQNGETWASHKATDGFITWFTNQNHTFCSFDDHSRHPVQVKWNSSKPSNRARQRQAITSQHLLQQPNSIPLSLSLSLSMCAHSFFNQRLSFIKKFIFMPTVSFFISLSFFLMFLHHPFLSNHPTFQPMWTIDWLCKYVLRISPHVLCIFFLWPNLAQLFLIFFYHSIAIESNDRLHPVYTRARIHTPLP